MSIVYLYVKMCDINDSIINNDTLIINVNDNKISFKNEDAIRYYIQVDKDVVIFKKILDEKIQFTFYVTNKLLDDKKRSINRLILLKKVEYKNTILYFLKTSNAAFQSD